MTDRRFPTRMIQTARKALGSAGQGVGWLEDLAVRFRQLNAQLAGVQRRLTSDLAYGVPSAVTGELLFKANTAESITLPVFPFIEMPTTTVANLVVNPIIKAGQTYRIPIMMPPPGVFMAHNLMVNIEAGVNLFGGQQRPYLTPLNDYRQDNNGGMISSSPLDGNLTFSQQQQVLNGTTNKAVWGQQTYLPYFWNIIDEKSGRQYAQDWLPHGLLMNSRFGASNALTMSSDGDFFEFDAPWLFERDAQVSFLFRPIMDLYQMAADQAPAIPGGTLRPYPTRDDLNQGTRNMQATVRVEMHGNRYYGRQDVLKEGAYL
jgi:hypothetical protein